MTDDMTVIFVHSGSMCVKAALKMLMKLTICLFAWNTFGHAIVDTLVTTKNDLKKVAK